jgi:hypothetical protein
LVEGGLNRTQFQLLSEQKLQIPGIHVTAAVIGASHIVTYDAGAVQLHEIFACVGVNNVPSRSLSELRGISVHHYPGLRYEFKAHKVKWSDPEPRILSVMIRQAAQLRDNGGIGLVVDFPSGGHAVIPKTIVLGQKSMGGTKVTFTTAHSYPNVRGLVISQSSLQIT